MNSDRSLWSILAGTRFVLAAIVANAHCGLALPPGAELTGVYLFGRQLGPLAAILGFLIISGFSIAHSYEQPIGFYARRFSRIFPSLFAAVVFFAIVSAVFGPITTTYGTVAYPPRPVDFIACLTGLNGWFVGSFLGPTWSLSAEIFFYAITPVLARASVPVLSALIGASALVYWFNADLGIGSLSGALHGLAPASLFWAWGLGFVFYRTRSIISAAALAGLGCVLLTRLNYEGGVYAPATFFVAAMAIVGGSSIDLGPKTCRALNYLGDLSYPLYLIHFPVIVLLNGVFGWTSYPLLIAASFAAAIACLHWAERPARKWLSGLPRRLREPAAA